MRQVANRAAIIVRPKVKFVEWVRSADEESRGITAEDIAREPNVYLVDDYEMDEEKDRLLAEYCEDIFGEELNGWNTDESAWPKTRDLKTFKEWFHVDFHSMVIDLCD